MLQPSLQTREATASAYMSECGVDTPGQDVVAQAVEHAPVKFRSLGTLCQNIIKGVHLTYKKPKSIQYLIKKIDICMYNGHISQTKVNVFFCFFYMFNPNILATFYSYSYMPKSNVGIIYK